jgi:diadenosine tetraphosphate (Ap4A) HIT family hydrolase
VTKEVILSSPEASPEVAEPVFAIEGLTPGQCAILARARTFKLYKKMRADLLSNVCPFCKLDPKFNQVVTENAWWYAWQSPSPEKGTKHHFIIAPKQHVTAIADLKPLQWDGLWEILEDLDRQHKIDSSGIQIRDGDARLSAGTVEHLHVHKMVPDGTVRVESPFYKGAASEREGHARAIVFEKLRAQIEEGGMTQAAAVSALSTAELSLIDGRIDP